MRRDRNRSIKSRTRTLVNKAMTSVGTDSAEASVKAAVSALDRAAQDGIIHKNAAARGKSRLLKRYNLATASAVAAAAAAGETPTPESGTKGRTSSRSSSTRSRTTRSTSEKTPDKTPRTRSRKSE